MAADIKFYLDENISTAITIGLRRRGIDVLTTQEAHMIGAHDPDQLALAMRLGRVIFSQDRDMLRLHRANLNHMGIVFLTRRSSIGEMVRGLIRIHRAKSAEEMRGQVEYL